ncbi:probable membrane protein STY1534 [Polaromonas sp. CG9_12]|nr:probable membrane protein STY1534 [Polaromonas sp. CG9_12]
MALPLAIFLGFRNSVAYDRYWEGRKLWGELVLRCHSLSRQCQSFIQPDSDMPAQMPEVLAARLRLVYRTIAFVQALRLQLRDQTDYSEIRRWVPQAEWSLLQAASNKHDRLVLEWARNWGSASAWAGLTPA